ncbi:MAG: hypothetical protein HYV14_03595 [Elusimicrobia bacterium]|nr:hypothetical protein [Elusimicrobiota bacterium]
MPRGLKTAFFVLFLAAAVRASAGPDDPFDARVPGALQPGQREFLLALDQGRYALKDGRLVDSRPADPARPVLTNARVAELLAGPSGGTIPGGSSPSAAGDAAYQRALSRVPKGAPARMDFDGGAARSGDIRGPPSGGAASGAAADPAVLQTRLLARLVFKGTKPEREALGEAVGLILKSKTGRELAAEFVRERAAAEVTMDDLDHNSGETDTALDPPKVTLSREYLAQDPDHTRVAMAGTLAHELFGHAFEIQRSKRAGFPEVAHDHYRGDELGSRLIDWLVQTELAGKVVDGSPKDFLDDPEGYYRELLTRDPYYILTFSPKEMKNPVTTLRGRGKLIDADAAKTEAEIKENETWRPVVAHFIKVHRVAKERLAPAEKKLDDYLKWAKGHQEKLAASSKALEEQIKEWSSPAGAKEKKELIAAAGSPYLGALEARLTARARALRRLRAGRGPAGIVELPPLVITAPKPGGGPPIDMEELGRLYAEDLEKNPRHWK